MRKNIIILTFIAIFISLSISILFASENNTKEKTEIKIVPVVMNAKGRYQIFYMTLNDNPVRMTIFDTETGQLWQNTSSSMLQINPDLWNRISPKDLNKN